jgi:hypothetical protein
MQIVPKDYGMAEPIGSSDAGHHAIAALHPNIRISWEIFMKG